MSAGPMGAPKVPGGGVAGPRDAAATPPADAGGAAGDVAVVIVNYNTAQLLDACLTSLAGGGLAGVAARVWVVDNASSDESADMVRARHPWATVIANPDNPGFAAANNRALRAAGFGEPARTSGHGEPERFAVHREPARTSGHGESARSAVHREPARTSGHGEPERPAPFRHALLLNPDTLVPAGAVAALVEALEREPDIGAVGPKLVLADGSLDLACRRGFPTPAVAFYRFSGLARLFPRSPRFGRYNMTYLDPDAATDVDAVVGACMLVRGAAIRQVGLLDERFWMYGEDLDWALRLRRAGWRVAYRPHVVVRHVKRAASRQSAEARYQFQRAMWLFYQKHYAALTPRPVHALVLLGLALRGGPRLVRAMRAAPGGGA